MPVMYVIYSAFFQNCSYQMYCCLSLYANVIPNTVLSFSRIFGPDSKSHTGPNVTFSYLLPSTSLYIYVLVLYISQLRQKEYVSACIV